MVRTGGERRLLVGLLPLCHRETRGRGPAREIMPEASGLLRGKRGLILGVANNRSLAWGIAKACHRQGAELAFTYQGEAFKRRVEPLAQEVGGLVIGHCDVTEPATIDAAFATLAAKWSALDFLVHAIAFSDKDQLSGRYIDTTPDNFRNTMLVSCYSFTAVAQRAEKADARRGCAAHAHLLWRREMDAPLQCDGSRQGGAGGIGALSRGRLGREEHSRQRHFLGPDQDAGSIGNRRLP